MKIVFYLFAAVSVLRMMMPKKFGKMIVGLTVITVAAAVSVFVVSMDFTLPELSFPDTEEMSELVYTFPIRETVYRLFYEQTGEYPKSVEVEVQTDGDSITVQRITVCSDRRSVNVLEYLCEQLNTDRIVYGDDR